MERGRFISTPPRYSSLGILVGNGVKIDYMGSVMDFLCP